jgi:hypothetical protein
LLSQSLVVPAQLLHFLGLRIALGLEAALVRGQALENTGLAFATPGDQVRGVKAFTAEQDSDGAGLSGGIDLSQEAQLVLGGEASALGVGDNLRVRSRRCSAAAGKAAGGAEELRLVFTLIPILALLSNYGREDCLINVGTEGWVGYE